jgi:hypothetical protein
MVWLVAGRKDMNELNKKDSRWYRKKIIYYGFVSTALVILVTAFPVWITDTGISEVILVVGFTLLLVFLFTIPLLLYGWGWGRYVRNSLGDGQSVSTMHEWAIVGGGIAIFVTTALYFSGYAYAAWRNFICDGCYYEAPEQGFVYGIPFMPVFHLASMLIGIVVGAMLGRAYGRWHTRTALNFFVAIGLFLGTSAVVGFDYMLYIFFTS